MRFFVNRTFTCLLFTLVFSAVAFVGTEHQEMRNMLGLGGFESIRKFHIHDRFQNENPSIVRSEVAWLQPNTNGSFKIFVGGNEVIGSLRLSRVISDGNHKFFKREGQLCGVANRKPKPQISFFRLYGGQATCIAPVFNSHPLLQSNFLKTSTSLNRISLPTDFIQSHYRDDAAAYADYGQDHAQPDRSLVIEVFRRDYESNAGYWIFFWFVLGISAEMFTVGILSWNIRSRGGWCMAVLALVLLGKAGMTFNKAQSNYEQQEYRLSQISTSKADRPTIPAWPTIFSSIKTSSRRF